jgi:hypothetical protein
MREVTTILGMPQTFFLVRITFEALENSNVLASCAKDKLEIHS